VLYDILFAHNVQFLVEKTSFFSAAYLFFVLIILVSADKAKNVEKW
jgi:hypothetical protein